MSLSTSVGHASNKIYKQAEVVSVLHLTTNIHFLPFRLLFGPCIPPTYRLCGPHSWAGARDAILFCKRNIEAPTMTRTAVGENNLQEIKTEGQNCPSFRSNLTVKFPNSLFGLSFLVLIFSVTCGRYFDFFWLQMVMTWQWQDNDRTICNEHDNCRAIHVLVFLLYLLSNS